MPKYDAVAFEAYCNRRYRYPAGVAQDPKAYPEPPSLDAVGLLDGVVDEPRGEIAVDRPIRLPPAFLP